MPSQKGRDFLLKIGDQQSPEVFTAIGAARTNQMKINNSPIEDTSMQSDGIQSLIGDAGIQSMEVSVNGLFKDDAAEEVLRSVAFSGAARNFQLAFPNGDVFEAAFVIKDYTRGGSYDGLETFSATLLRSGAGTYTAA